MTREEAVKIVTKALDNRWFTRLNCPQNLAPIAVDALIEAGAIKIGGTVNEHF